MNPILSIVMPTHNRYQYAKWSIISILKIEHANFELIVHDTSTNNSLEKFIMENIMDERLKYFHCKKILNMTENHNMAMSLAIGEYVCLIGDDDTIMQQAIDAVTWAKNNEIDVLSPLICANYAWPDFRSLIFGMRHASRLYIKRKFSKIRKISTEVSLDIALGRAAQGTENLPRVYHGFVRRKIMERIHEKSGSYFHGSSPDISGAVGVALLEPNFVEVDYPLTLPGASAKSNTGRSAVNTHKGSLASDPQTSDFAAERWPLELPRYFSVETVWAHAAIETISRIDENKLIKFDFIKLYAICWVRHKEYRWLTLETFKNGAWSQWQKVKWPKLKFVIEIYKVIVSRLIYLAGRALWPTAAGKRAYIENLKTIEDAQIALDKYIIHKKYRLKEFLES